MAKLLAPEVRAQFAKRLKEMRIRNGFIRARYFAKSLGIEENRYTRYERAEVEPSLTLLHKMCDILRVSPNALMGFAEYEGNSPSIPAFAEDSASRNTGTEDDVTRHRDLLAWRLASETVTSRSRHRTRGRVVPDPLGTTQDIGKLYRKLQSDPFSTVAEIVAEPALKDLGPERKAEFAELVDAYTDSVAKAAPGKLRR